MKKFIYLIIMTLPVLVAKTEIPESNDPIKIIKNDWSSQIILAEVVGNIFKQLGYKIEFVNLNSNNQWSMLKEGRPIF